MNLNTIGKGQHKFDFATLTDFVAKFGSLLLFAWMIASPHVLDKIAKEIAKNTKHKTKPSSHHHHHQRICCCCYDPPNPP
jgi:hypothetical protein